jgi:hypothetical protein
VHRVLLEREEDGDADIAASCPVTVAVPTPASVLVPVTQAAPGPAAAFAAGLSVQVAVGPPAEAALRGFGSEFIAGHRLTPYS